MITIRELLTANGYEQDLQNISETILNKKVNSTNVRRTGTLKWDLFDGFELTDENDPFIYTINLEENEFSKFCIQYLDDEGYNCSEEGYDEDLNLLYSVDV